MKWNVPIVLVIALCSVSANAAEVWSSRFAIEEMRILGQGLVIKPYGSAASLCNGNRFRVFAGILGQNGSSIANISRAIMNAEELALFAALLDISEGGDGSTLDLRFFRVKFEDSNPGCYVRAFEVESAFSMW